MTEFVDFLKPERLKEMELGECSMALPLFKGLLPDEPVMWVLAESNLAKTDFIFDMKYFGVSLGQVAVTVTGNVVAVEEL